MNKRNILITLGILVVAGVTSVVLLLYLKGFVLDISYTNNVGDVVERKDTVNAPELPDVPIESVEESEIVEDNREAETVSLDDEQEQNKNDLMESNTDRVATTAYALCDLNVYKETDTSSEVIGVIKMNEPVRFYENLNDWNVIDINGEYGYIEKDTITFFPPGTEIAKSEENDKEHVNTNSNNQQTNVNSPATGNSSSTENSDSATTQQTMETPTTQPPAANDSVNNTPSQEKPAGNDDYVELDPEIAEWLEKYGCGSVVNPDWDLSGGEMSKIGEGHDPKWDELHFE